MNDLVPTNDSDPIDDYRVWYDQVYQGTRIEHGKDKYFIPDTEKICSESFWGKVRYSLKDWDELEQFKL